MKCESAREELEAFALGALEAAEAREVALHVRDCEACAQMVRAYRLAIDQLALAVPYYRAPARLKERILGAIGVLRPAFYLSALRRSGWAAAAAAVLIAFAIGGVAWAVILSHEVSRLREDNKRLAVLSQLDEQQRAALLRLSVQLDSAQSEQQRMSTTLEEQAKLILLALDPDLIPSELHGTQFAPGAVCNYVWSTKETLGGLTCKNLPSTGIGLTYELWATKGGKAVPLGSFTPRADGTASLLVKFPADVEGPVSDLYVTLEEVSRTARTKPSSQVMLARLPDQQAAR